MANYGTILVVDDKTSIFIVRVLKDAIDANTEVIPLEKMEEDHVRKAVDKCHGNISKAAELLEISRQRLYKKLGK